METKREGYSLSTQNPKFFIFQILQHADDVVSSQVFHH